MKFDELPYKLEIKAPALEYLNFGGHLDSILLEDLANLVEAVIDIDVDLTKIDYYEHYGSRVWDFIGELGDIKSLHLSANTTEVKQAQVFSCFIIKWLRASILDKQ